MVLLGHFADVVGIVWLSDKRLARSFYRGSSSWPTAYRVLVVSIASLIAISHS